MSESEQNPEEFKDTEVMQQDLYSVSGCTLLHSLFLSMSDLYAMSVWRSIQKYVKEIFYLSIEY